MPNIPYEQLIFLIFSAIAITCSIMMILAKDPVHSALFLVLTFFNVAAIYVLLGAEFLAVLQVMVYAGAILVLFLFVIMLLQVRPGPSLDPLHSIQRPVAVLVGLGFITEFFLTLFGSQFPLNGKGSVLDTAKFLDPNGIQAQTMGNNLNTELGSYVASQPGITYTDGHTALLGSELYTRYLFPFEVASVVLLVAAIGAIVLAKRHMDIPTKDETTQSNRISLSGMPLGDTPQGQEILRRDRQLVEVGAADSGAADSGVGSGTPVDREFRDYEARAMARKDVKAVRSANDVTNGDKMNRS